MSSSDGSLARVALGSIGVALVVLALKVLAWRLTGSVALYSDALESTINVVTASIAWQAVRIGARPADSDHPFGHHKAEYLSAVVSGVLIVLAAILVWAWIIFEIYQVVHAPQSPDAARGLSE